MRLDNNFRKLRRKGGRRRAKRLNRDERTENNLTIVTRMSN